MRLIIKLNGWMMILIFDNGGDNETDNGCVIMRLIIKLNVLIVILIFDYETDNKTSSDNEADNSTDSVMYLLVSNIYLVPVV